MARCYGCNCHYPTDVASPTQFGSVTFPCDNEAVGDDSTYSQLPCGFAVIFGCELAWWKHTDKTNGGRDALPMLVPTATSAAYFGPYIQEPSQTYFATFLGKDCQSRGGTYVQWEGTFGSPAHRVCDLSDYNNLGLFRDPFYRDSNNEVVRGAFRFDLRAYNQDLRTLFGGDDDDAPCCCWTIDLDSATGTEPGYGQPIFTWRGWTLDLTDPGDYLRTIPRLHYNEGLEGFWQQIGKTPPYYALDASYRGAFDPTQENQFTLQNEDEWPQLPKRVCVVPVRWPYFNSPCSSSTEQCQACAPAVDTSCGAGLVVEFVPSECTDLGGGSVGITYTGTIYGQCYPDVVAGAVPTEHNGTLPSGVSDPGAPCGYWWKVFFTESVCSVGALVYWDGSAWKAKIYKTEDGSSWSVVGDATKANEECRCDGIYFDVSGEVELTCCETTCGSCEPPTTLYADDGTTTVTLTWDGVSQWCGSVPGGGCFGGCCPEAGNLGVCLECVGGASYQLLFNATACDTVSATCSPFSATFTIGNCLGTCDSTGIVDVTE